MKKLYFAIVGVSLLQFSPFAQDFLETINIPSGNEIHALAINSNDNIFAAVSYNNGIYRSTDNGESWKHIDNGLTDQYLFIKCISSSSNNIYAGAFGSGVFRSTDDGENWVKIADIGIESLAIKTVDTNSNQNDFIFATSYNNVFRSADSGDNWTQLNNGLPQDFLPAIIINAKGSIFAGTGLNGVYRSTDNGDSWEEINNGLKYTSFGDVFTPSILSLAVNSNDDIFAGTTINFGGSSYIANVFRSTDNGGSWVKTNENLPHYKVLSLVINSDNYIFAGTEEGGIFRSTDNGNNWFQINNGLTNLSLYRVMCLAINSRNQIFAGAYNGIFRSTDNGDNWVPVNNGLSNSVENNNNFTPITFALYQNYPNPFNPSTKIKYSIPGTSFVTLKIYDILGREMSTLVNEEKLSGNYEIEFNGRGISSGIYFYKIQTGDYSLVKKMILMK